MADDFREHLDTARLWWALDEAVLHAIADGRSTREQFRAIALYVIELKAQVEGSGEADNTAALAKIAIRVAGTPVAPASSAPSLRPWTPRRRLVLITLLALVGLMVVLTVAAAADIITLPSPIEDLLNKIGISVEG